MIKDALEKGLINENTTVIEPTSGNTGIALASVCAGLGIKLILTMPSSMNLERRKLLKALGAQLVLTEAPKGMKGAVLKAQELSEEIENSFLTRQKKQKKSTKEEIKKAKKKRLKTNKKKKKLKKTI